MYTHISINKFAQCALGGLRALASLTPPYEAQVVALGKDPFKQVKWIIMWNLCRYLFGTCWHFLEGGGSCRIV